MLPFLTEPNRSGCLILSKLPMTPRAALSHSQLCYPSQGPTVQASSWQQNLLNLAYSRRRMEHCQARGLTPKRFLSKTHCGRNCALLMALVCEGHMIKFQHFSVLSHEDSQTQFSFCFNCIIICRTDHWFHKIYWNGFTKVFKRGCLWFQNSLLLQCYKI